MPGTEQDARELVDAGNARGVHVRIIGGLAVKIRCPSAEHRGLVRVYSDLDCVGYRSQRPQVDQLLQGLSYVPDRRFNALRGDRRLLYSRPEHGFDIDVFLDIFPMCHTLNLVGRLESDTYTVPLSELLLSKLQIVELNEKDVKDVYALLYDHELGGAGDPEAIDTSVIERICGEDWGWYTTVTHNLAKVSGLADNYLDGERKEKVRGRLEQLTKVLQTTPKSLKWKARAAVGERVRWYDLPEEVEHRKDD